MSGSVKTNVRPVVCDKCHKYDFNLYRRTEEPLNYFLICNSCGRVKEFRVFLIWDVIIDKNVAGMPQKGLEENERDDVEDRVVERI